MNEYFNQSLNITCAVVAVVLQLFPVLYQTWGQEAQDLLEILCYAIKASSKQERIKAETNTNRAALLLLSNMLPEFSIYLRELLTKRRLTLVNHKPIGAKAAAAKGQRKKMWERILSFPAHHLYWLVFPACSLQVSHYWRRVEPSEAAERSPATLMLLTTAGTDL